AIALAIAHEDTAVGGDGDAVREIELPGAGAGLAPRALERARRRELMHATVAVAVRDVQITLGPDREIRGAIERPGRPADRQAVLAVIPGVGWHVQDPECPEQLALRRELWNGAGAVVGRPEGSTE